MQICNTAIILTLSRLYILPLNPAWNPAQAMQAAKELQRNLAADSAGVAYISRMWCATVSAHQMVCGDLAAWPRCFYVSRLIAYLGTPPPLWAVCILVFRRRCWTC